MENGRWPFAILHFLFSTLDCIPLTGASRFELLARIFPPMSRSDADTSRPARFALLAAPAWVVLGLCFLLPLAVIFTISFGRNDGFGGYEPVGDVGAAFRDGTLFDNYARTLHPRYLGVLWRSTWMAVVTTVLTALIAYPLAYWIAVSVRNARWKTLLLLAVVVPFWTSFLIRTYAWILILRPLGLLNSFLLNAGVIDEPLKLLYTEWAVLIGLVYGELPFMVLPLYASLEKLDRTLLEASNDLGAGWWSTFTRVTFPLSAPGLAAGIVLVFIPSFGQYIVSDLLGGSRSMLLGNLVQDQFAGGGGGMGDKPFGAAVAFELMGVVLMMLLVYWIWAKKRSVLE